MGAWRSRRSHVVGARRPDARPSAPATRGGLAVCPHCWGVNPHADRLCTRCGADMHTILQESGGLRATAPVQSPVPVRVRGRLSTVQRALLLAFVLSLVAAQVLVAVFADRRAAFTGVPAAPAAGR